MQFSTFDRSKWKLLWVQIFPFRLKFCYICVFFTWADPRTFYKYKISAQRAEITNVIFTFSKLILPFILMMNLTLFRIHNSIRQDRKLKFEFCWTLNNVDRPIETWRINFREKFKRQMLIMILHRILDLHKASEKSCFQTNKISPL